MTVDAGQIDALDHKGEYGAIVRAFGNAAQHRGSDALTRVVVAHAYAITGNFDAAWKLAAQESESTDTRLHARAFYTLALVSQARGDLDAAEQQLRRAIGAGETCSQWIEAAWAQITLFRLLHGPRSRHAEAPSLSHVRKLVARAANVHVSAYLHVCVASVEGQACRLDESLRHCDIAESLLKQLPHTWLTANVLLNRASVSLLQCDFNAAATHIKAGRLLAANAGDIRNVLMFDTDAAHVELAMGRFDEARQIFSRLRTSTSISSITFLGVIDGLARVELAVGDFDACESALNAIDARLYDSPSLSSNYTARCSEITRAKLLLSRCLYPQALEQLRRLESTDVMRHDVPFAAMVHLLMAHASSETADPTGAARHLLAASSSELTDVRELQHESYTRLAHVLGEKSSLGVRLENRATRLAKHLGMAWNGAIHATPDPAVPQTPTRNGNWQTVEFAESCVGLIDLAFSPQLLVEELIETLRSLGFRDIERAESKSRGRVSTVEEVATLTIGVGETRQLTVRCAVPEDPLKALLLADVFRIARAALSLERFRREERSRAALWPADPVETEAGALFLSEEMQTLLATARRVAAANIPVLITGETGTGKEVLARLIHAYSPRAKATFMPFNCTATPKDMLDSQLFGHRRGAFTGATDSFQGVIRAAGGGTLFLDEIGETTPDVQPKLLRFLESSEVHPIGEAHPTRVDVRVIAATNANLDALVSQGRFRQDLLYRLNTVELPVPPLRERRVEIPALAAHYLRKYALENHKGDLRLAEDTMEYLVLYRWPGNVRQLANEMRRMAALAEKGAMLMPEHLSPELAASRRTLPPSERVLDDTEVVVRLDQPMPAGVGHLERVMIQHALRKCGGRLEETATMLGISRKGLYLKRLRYGLIEPGEDAEEAEVAS